jgi:hypothetical protein
MYEYIGYLWIPFEVLTLPGDNAHDIAERTFWWMQLTNPLLEKLRDAGYKSARIMTRRDMKSHAWVVVAEDIRRSGRPLLWDILQHSGLYAGSGNTHSAQLIWFNILWHRGLDRTHGRIGWTIAPCKECFPEEYAEAVKNGAHP